MNYAVGFFTHLFGAEVERRYEELKAALDVPVYLIAEVGTPIPSSLHSQTCFFNFSQLARRVPRIVGENLTPGNCHLTMLAFRERFPHHDFYWQVEYDVAFSGPWTNFFALWENNQADLLAAHVRDFEQEPNWCWWGSLQISGLSHQDYRRAFLPIYRISRTALDHLERAVHQGAVGHFEGLIPTLLDSASFRVEDINQHQLYTSSCSPEGDLYMGTMRFKPNHYFLLGRNMLYHPVKPGFTHNWQTEHVEWLRYFLRRPTHLIADVKNSLTAILRSHRKSSRV